jgi:hypothetical protein
MMHSVTGTREVEILYAGVRTFEVKFQYHRFLGSRPLPIIDGSTLVANVHPNLQTVAYHRHGRSNVIGRSGCWWIMTARLLMT